MSRPQSFHVRRALATAIAGLALGACASAGATRLASSALPDRGAPASARSSAPYREQTADQQVLHVLNRLAFGPRPGDVAKVRAMGVDRWIDQQLAPDRMNDARADALVASYGMLRTPSSQMVAYYRDVTRARRLDAGGAGDSATRRETRQAALRENPELLESGRRLQRGVADVESAKLLRAVASERQLQEVMTDFWANHFSIFKGKGRTRLFVAEYDRDVIRPHAMGRFRDLLGGVAKSPAMLFYLDNWQSVADTNRESLAIQQLRARRPALARRADARRERQRAQPQGQEQQRQPRGVNENYARELLELHTLGVDGGYTQKDVMEVARALTGWTIDQQRGAFVFRPAAHDAEPKRILGVDFPAGRGIEEGEAVLDLLARHPSTARFIARKLVVRLVSDTPPQTLVDRAAKTFLETDGDIRAVVRTIVTSDEFFSAAAYRAKVKTPFELVASGLRAMGAEPDTTPRAAQVVARLGQPIYGRQTPDGWPDDANAWINAGAILNRMNFGLLLAGNRIPGATLDRWPSTAQLRGAPREKQVDVVIAELLGGGVSRETRDVLMSGENPLLARASEASRDSLAGLARIVGLALGAPEFQRR